MQFDIVRMKILYLNIDQKSIEARRKTSAKNFYSFRHEKLSLQLTWEKNICSSFSVLILLSELEFNWRIKHLMKRRDRLSLKTWIITNTLARKRFRKHVFHNLNRDERNRFNILLKWNGENITRKHSRSRQEKTDCTWKSSTFPSRPIEGMN